MHSHDPLIGAMHEWMSVIMHQSMSDSLRYCRENNLSMPQIGALFFAAKGGGGGVSALGDHLDVTSAAASQMLDRLVQQGFILRTENPADRRAKQIVLTEKGREVTQGIAYARQQWLDDLAATLSPQEKEHVTEALRILIDKARRLAQNPESA
jgi:DNA-binding MarR family transcriptional regulator